MNPEKPVKQGGTRGMIDRLRATASRMLIDGARCLGTARSVRMEWGYMAALAEIEAGVAAAGAIGMRYAVSSGKGGPTTHAHEPAMLARLGIGPAGVAFLRRKRT